MRFLRTASTRRLLATIAGLLVAIAAGTTIAVAASAGGPKPPRTTLAKAIRSAMAAPTVRGITARISFTNKLIDSSNIQGSDPLLNGASGRLWLSNDGRMRLELQSDNGDAQVVVKNRAFWVYDPSSNTVYQGTLPAQTSKKGTAAKEKAGLGALPALSQIQTNLNQFAQNANLSGAIPSDVAGRPTYTVRISPKHDGGLLGSAQLAWDAIRGVPLRVAVYARGSSSPVLELEATSISYGAVRTKVFSVSPPKGAKVVKISTPATSGAAADRKSSKAKAHGRKADAQISGVAAVAKHLKFKLAAPSKLVGLPRQSVSLLDWGGSPAALVSYGQNLGGIAVIEQTAGSTKQQAAPASGDKRGLSLPTVSIHGTTAQELPTALGTVVRFTRGGVTYTVLGSVPAVAAEAAARALQ